MITSIRKVMTKFLLWKIMQTFSCISLRILRNWLVSLLSNSLGTPIDIIANILLKFRRVWKKSEIYLICIHRHDKCLAYLFKISFLLRSYWKLLLSSRIDAIQIVKLLLGTYFWADLGQMNACNKCKQMSSRRRRLQQLSVTKDGEWSRDWERDRDSG